MARRILNDEQDAYLKSIAKGRMRRDILAMFNDRYGLDWSEARLKSYFTNHHITSGLKTFVKDDKYRLLNKEQHEYLLSICKGLSNSEVARMMNEEFCINVTTKQIKGYKANHNINSGLTGRFGDRREVPTNGQIKKGERISPKTEFKRGNKPTNTVPIGTRRNRKGYWWMKYYDDRIPQRFNWEPIHKHIWELENGPVPKGYNLTFRDGDADNICIENLVLITTRQKIIMTKKKLYHKGNKELNETGINIAKVLDKYYKLKK